MFKAFYLLPFNNIESFCRNNGTLIVEEAPSNKLREIAAVNDRLGYEYSWLKSEEIRQRYQGALNFNGYNAILDHDGGALLADKCLKTMMASCGNELKLKIILFYL